ncbi:GNAT family N-acetyltransferase [Paenalkalicoccus suaedae]|uniref:GNAT family N-acetyltransferase n=1 Tax=Paenalkalicoccus suaedae TaxID=2592382 RepID=A0A859FEK3_9BACI|nr:GNAT family N-acetyltransferase [Paenalkalicoccus suaedae]QKS71361.1 GNAT family N-acetyltransferase [Paenalkalicoccus suaedae]
MTVSISLRPLSLDDAPWIQHEVSDPDIAKSTLTIPHPYPEDGATMFLQAVLAKQRAGEIEIFAIVDDKTQQNIGVINLNINVNLNHGEIGYWISKRNWGKGYATEASRAIIQLGFQRLNLHRIYGRAFASNVGSSRVLEKAGLRYEGTLREHLKRDSTYHDTKVYGLLKTD